jgi:hypothetical protein
MKESAAAQLGSVWYLEDYDFFKREWHSAKTGRSFTANVCRAAVIHITADSIQIRATAKYKLTNIGSI